MTLLEERHQQLELLTEAMAAGARQESACAVLGFSPRTVQRWQEGAAVRGDQRPLRQYEPPHKLTAVERAAILAVANSPEFGQLPPSQIVPRLADQGRYLASESTFYRVLKAETKQPPAKAGGFVWRTESPDTRRLNDAFNRTPS
jgi:hypothetical protein